MGGHAREGIELHLALEVRELLMWEGLLHLSDIGGLSGDQKKQFRAAIRLNRERYTAWHTDPAQRHIEH